MLKPFLTQFKTNKVDDSAINPFTLIYDEKLCFNNIVKDNNEGAGLLMATKTATQSQSETLDNDYDDIGQNDQYSEDDYLNILLSTHTSTKTLLENTDKD